MKNQNTKETRTHAPKQGFTAPVRVYLSKDSQYLTHVLPGGMRITKHVNYYKAILASAEQIQNPAGEGVEASGSQVA